MAFMIVDLPEHFRLGTDLPLILAIQVFAQDPDCSTSFIHEPDEGGM
jgi:hypothetical protein